MNTQRILAFAAAMALSFAAHAHDCSGGAAGGMDATGNQCNDGGSVAAVSASTEGATIAAYAPAPLASDHAASAVKSCSAQATQTAHAKHRSRHVARSAHAATS